MSKPTYLFYDIETTGLNKCFDQVLQFAAIRTDDQLNELSRHEIAVKLNNDVIPSPGAVITHRIGVADFKNGLTELEAIEKIHALFNTPGTISVGYNTLGFDDEFLRFSFYKNLLPPYTHQYANQCGRMDIYPITLLYYLFKRDHLIWPENNGVISFKLENINAANHFFEGAAHNAMVDVEVTLALARKLFSDQTMWHFVIDYFEKKTDENRIMHSDASLSLSDKQYKTGFMVNGKIGAASSYIAPVLSLGQHQHYKNQSVWLRLDNPDLSKTTLESIRENTRAFKKRLAEPPIFLPEKARYFDLLSDDRKQITQSNKSWLQKNPGIFAAIAQFHQNEKYPEVLTRDVDAALYSMDFPKPAEESLFRRFHATAPKDKLSVANQFPNKDREQQAIRIIGRHFPEFLPDNEREIFEAYRNSTPVDFRGQKKLTRDAALAEIQTLSQNTSLDKQQMHLLAELKVFLE